MFFENKYLTGTNFDVTTPAPINFLTSMPQSISRFIQPKTATRRYWSMPVEGIDTTRPCLRFRLMSSENHTDSLAGNEEGRVGST